MFSHSIASFLVFGYSNRKADYKPVKFSISEKGKQTQVKNDLTLRRVSFCALVTSAWLRAWLRAWSHWAASFPYRVLEFPQACRACLSASDPSRTEGLT